LFNISKDTDNRLIYKTIPHFGIILFHTLAPFHSTLWQYPKLQSNSKSLIKGSENSPAPGTAPLLTACAKALTVAQAAEDK